VCNLLSIGTFECLTATVLWVERVSNFLPNSCKFTTEKITDVHSFNSKSKFPENGVLQSQILHILMQILKQNFQQFSNGQKFGGKRQLPPVNPFTLPRHYWWIQYTKLQHLPQLSCSERASSSKRSTNNDLERRQACTSPVSYAAHVAISAIKSSCKTTAAVAPYQRWHTEAIIVPAVC